MYICGGPWGGMAMLEGILPAAMLDGVMVMLGCWPSLPVWACCGSDMVCSGPIPMVIPLLVIGPGPAWPYMGIGPGWPMDIGGPDMAMDIWAPGAGPGMDICGPGGGMYIPGWAGPGYMP